MIIVRVELHSAKTGKVQELARMAITNTGQGTESIGSYRGVTYIGRSTVDLNRRQASRTGAVAHFPRKSLHVWNLVTRMLHSMEYTA